MFSQPDISKRGLVLLLLFGAVIWFCTLDYRKLVKPDEGRYAEISREMVISGDWLTPRLNGIKYFEKPPLQYWTTAVAFKAFGLNEWSARLWTGLTGFLTILLVGWAGKRLFNREAGLYAGMVLLSNFYFLSMGHINTLDMGLTFFTTLTLVGFLVAQRVSAGDKERTLGMLTAWAGMGGAVLSKGLIGIVLPGTTLALYTIFTTDWTILRRLYLVRGLLIFLSITAPWFIAVSIKNPEFAWFFFIHEHFLRYATPEAGREGPIYYFLPIFLAGILPWIVFMPEAIWTAIRHIRMPDGRWDKPIFILLIWTVFVFVFFSLSSSKLPAYILPMFPSLALLIGNRLAQLQAKQLTMRMLPVGLLMLAGFFLIAYAADQADDAVSRPLYHQYSYWLYGATALMLGGVVYACLQSTRGRKFAAITSFAIAGTISGQIAGNGHETFSPTQSAHDLAEKIRPYNKQDIPFYSIRTYDQTLPFYLGRTLTLVDYSDEFSYGLKQEPKMAISNMDDFSMRWKNDEEALAVMQPDMFETLQAANYPMQVIAQDSSHVVVKKPKDIQ